jgi:dolichol-phosphate mannosyltransferase
MSPVLWVGNRLLTVVTNLLYGTALTDMETWYKMIPINILKSIRLESRGFEYERKPNAT